MLGPQLSHGEPNCETPGSLCKEETYEGMARATTAAESLIRPSQLTTQIDGLSVQIVVPGGTRATRTQTTRSRVASRHAAAGPKYPRRSRCTPASFQCDSGRTQISDKCGQRSTCTE